MCSDDQVLMSRFKVCVMCGVYWDARSPTEETHLYDEHQEHHQKKYGHQLTVKKRPIPW